jgi:hypothetical protein
MRNAKGNGLREVWDGRTMPDHIGSFGQTITCILGTSQKRDAENHPSRKIMEIPSNPAPKKLLSLVV